MTDFNLKALAREVIDEDTSEDLAQIIKEVRRRIPRDVTGEALDQALAPFVHDMIRKPWRPAPPAPSAKVTAIREAWRRKLDEIRYTVDGDSVRRLGDMSQADVIFVAEGLETQARQNQARAAWMRSWAAAMTEHGAARIRDLPDDVQRGMFGRTAA
jgi:hypothetical protein